ncbi:MAG: tRNA (adenosine(37)-N6)-threonylcarbamoyltransferase complex transferase subunit TsaD [Bacilli bacterium]|jgi:N6-L-threonylcarbamoyladenine synthase|nr:tRNA (adenosine(37)-N6)-threonylcarbamoyltransferase complex transferase subunit TsaD [Bacillota bacterium]HOA78388.1 tRNA (adenosine(37)-N6)-threonylcarbamoyltransferase complex transferase subunit TsaD [Bacilli bacterium]HPZ27117.1 tRNA (adenosine(37)-N6)-threonylcarbamoyltransferase complex transferase subunit TsaD [Bacilli bacterium]HQC89452.1 tRNA (adenosine(37)-N6)-threonylcarbamoyltransferase complex transferase subunit TsaD [Bacilli bacterium]
MLVLGIETSCDETAAAIVKDGREVISDVVYTQIAAHKEYGGVVPEIASRNHLMKITLVIEEAFSRAGMRLSDINLIAVTSRPGLIGSLLVGINAAGALALAGDKALVEVNHIHGHIYANYIEEDFRFPTLALIVSGGHTELVLMRDHFEFELIGQTLDDAVGECYDKVGRLIGLEYPAGPELDKLAQTGKATYDLPLIYLDKDKYDFSFSGLKTAVLNLVNTKKMRGEEISRADLAASFQHSVVRVLVDKTISAARKFNVKQIILAGGVAANRGLRTAMKAEADKLDDVALTMPSLRYCTDNAVMIAAAGYFQYKTLSK